MFVRLKGINWTTKKLADGTVKEYAYLGRGRGAIPLKGERGSDELIASLGEALARKRTPPQNVLSALIGKFEQSAEFTKKLAPRTQADYRKLFRLIDRDLGDFPLEALSDPAARGVFKDWRDKLAEQSLRQADAAWIALARVLSWALDRRKVPMNPCEKGGRLYNGTRADKVWTPEQEAAFLATASAPLRLAFLLALWTGQRQGDLLVLPWSAFDGTHIRLRQSKTGVSVIIPVAAPLKAALDATPRCSGIILLSSDGRPWTSHGFSSSWRKACKKAGVTDVTFNDLRGTFVTRAAIAGGTEPEIAAVTGHTLRGLRAILDTNYLHRDPALGENLFKKLEAGRFANRAANRPI
jgi:integrase